MLWRRGREWHNYSAGLSLDGPLRALLASVTPIFQGSKVSGMFIQGIRHNLSQAARWPSRLAVLLLLAACAGAPVQEMSDARQAVAAAEQTLAGKPVSPSLQSAQQYLQAAQAALDAADYSTARQDAQFARQLALRAMGLDQRSDVSGRPPQH